MADVKPEEQVAQVQQGGRKAAAADKGDVQAQKPVPAAQAPAEAQAPSENQVPAEAQAPAAEDLALARDTAAAAQAQAAQDQAKRAEQARQAEGAEAEAKQAELAAWYVADQPLFVTALDVAAAPARAFNPGDAVPGELVGRYGWHHLVHEAEWATAPPAPVTGKPGSEE